MLHSLSLYKFRNPLIFILLLLATDMVIVFDIPFLRQFLGFAFFTVIPGLFILHLLKFNTLGIAEKFVFSVGLSISFLMLCGLLINSLYPLLGYATPLSTNSLLVSFGVILVALIMWAYLTGRAPSFASWQNLRLSTREGAFLLLPAFFPFLSILGTRVMNVTDNNIILMGLLFLIPAYVIFVSIFRSRVPERIYPALICLIGISALMMLALRSNHLIGSDVHVEYYTFINTISNLRWNLEEPNLGICLSISLLPAIYQSLLSMNPEYIFKLIYPFFLFILPLAVYLLSRKYIGSFFAFLASFLFIAQPVFLWTPAEARTNMAVLFFVLAIMVLFHYNKNELGKKTLFIIFATSIVLSHYTTTYITFFILLAGWLGMQVLSLIISARKKSKTPGEITSVEQGLPDRVLANPVIKKRISLSLVGMFFIMLYFWYAQISGPTFIAGVLFVKQTLISLNSLFAAEAKSLYTQAAFGMAPLTKGPPQYLNFAANWLIVLLIAICVFVMIVKFRKMLSIPDSKVEKLGFLLRKVDAEYFVLTLACCAVLVLSITLPYVSTIYSIDRSKFQVMAFLAVFFVMGGMMISRLCRFKPVWLILPILVVYFLGTTGMTYQVFDVPQSMVLNAKGTYYETFYIHDQERQAALWMKQHISGETIYMDRLERLLVSQGGIPPAQVKQYRAAYLGSTEIDGYLCLRYYSVVNGKVYLDAREYNLKEIPGMLEGKNKIYASNGSEIYR